MPRKRGKTWYTDFYFDGERHRERIAGARIRPEAVKAETKIKHDLFQHKYGPPVALDKPLAEFVKEDYLPWADNNKKQPRHDHGTTRIWLELPSLKGKTVREISQFDIESAKIARRKSISRYNREVEPQTVNRELIIMSSLFHRAVDWHYRDDNPCKGVKRLDVLTGPPRYLLAEEEERLMPELWEGPIYLPRLVQLGLGTGMRQIEMRHLRKRDVDLARETLRVSDPKWKRDPRKTKGIPLSPEVSAMLREWMEMTESEWVFPSPQNARKPISQPTINTALNRACERAGITGIGFHALRHAFGTRLGEAGERLEVIAELMGHSKIEMTRIYVHPSLATKKQAVGKALVTSWSHGGGRKMEEKARKGLKIAG
jgi:integrase